MWLEAVFFSDLSSWFGELEQILMREPPYVNVEEWSDRFDHLWQDPAELLRRKGCLENLAIQFWTKMMKQKN